MFHSLFVQEYEYKKQDHQPVLFSGTQSSNSTKDSKKKEKPESHEIKKSSTDKGNNSEGSSDRTESKVNLQNF